MATCRRLGIETVAVFSQADRESLHVRQADQAVFIGPAAATESYLNIENILRAAQRSGADAVHPGYGFLAENSNFAQRVIDAGLKFVGPKPQTIEQMGSKTEAREICRKLGVPIVPGSRALSDQELLNWAGAQEFPLMLKSSAGGGGKGMRLIASAENLKLALPSARREALAAFGSDEVYLEKAIVRARHIEVQVLADLHGNAVHLGLRECSLQRRHQKIIEESPPVHLNPETAELLTQAALKLSVGVGYSSLGTVEFLVEGDAIYFLEMNTRLQVEHPVTEMVTGLDLVELQLKVAQGEPLGFEQEHINFVGHALEARIACEEPSNNFLPATGTVLDWRPGPEVRVDSYLEPGLEITTFYDSMVAKLISYDSTRNGALRKLKTSLAKTVLLGVSHNIDFLVSLLDHPQVRKGEQHTRLVESLDIPSSVPTIHQRLAAAAVHWERMGGRLNCGLLSRTLEVVFEQGPSVQIGGHHYSVEGRDYNIKTSPEALEVDGHRMPVVAKIEGLEIWVHNRHGTARFRLKERLPAPQVTHAPGSLVAPMPGRVVEVLVAVGDQVTSGQTLLKLEAMKMEQWISAPKAGKVESINCLQNEQVQAGAVLVVLSD